MGGYGRGGGKVSYVNCDQPAVGGGEAGGKVGYILRMTVFNENVTSAIAMSGRGMALSGTVRLEKVYSSTVLKCQNRLLCALCFG